MDSSGIDKPNEDTNIHVYEVPAFQESPYYNESRTSRFLAIGGLLLSILVAIIFFIGGLSIASKGDKEQSAMASGAFVIPKAGVEILLLLLNALITVCNESLGYIHTVSLRWALCRDKRLEFNSNLRLFSSSRISKPNSWYGNAVVFFGIVISHTASVMFITNSYDSLNSVVSGTACFMLSFGLLLQIVVAACSLFSKSAAFPTWSFSPLDTAAAAISQNHIRHRPNRCMISADSTKFASYPVYPTKNQPPLIKCHPWVKWIIVTETAIFVASVIWVFILFNAGGWDSKGITIDAIANDQQWFRIFFIIASLQAIVALSMHLVELLVNCTRDEAVWRGASRKQGLPRVQPNVLVSLLQSWQAILLLLLKPFTHWSVSSLHGSCLI